MAKFPGLMNNVKNTPTHTPTHTHEYTEVKVKEMKDKRVSLLMKPSTLTEFDEYAKNKGVSRNDLIHKLVTEFMRNDAFRLEFEEKYLNDNI